MYKLNQAMDSGKVWIQMNPTHVGELSIRFPMFDDSGRVSGQIPVILTNGRKVELLQNFNRRQVESSDDLVNFISDGLVALL